jgi:hypothetical protein
MGILTVVVRVFIDISSIFAVMLIIEISLGPSVLILAVAILQVAVRYNTSFKIIRDLRFSLSKL